MAKLVLSFSVRRFIIAIIHLNRKAYDKITGRRWQMNKENRGNKWLILVTILIMTVMGTLDSSICNVALPEIRHDLGVSMAGVEWITSIYLIVTIATILIFGKMGDIFGKVRIFQWGVILFTLGSFLCSESSDLEMLIFSRVIQALGQSAVLANNQGIVTETFPPEERGRTLGLVASSVALGTMLGPTIGGAILNFLPWSFIFLINVPIGILDFLIGLATLPRRKPASQEKLEIPACILMILSMFFIFTSLTLMQTNISYVVVGLFILGIVLLGVLLGGQKRSSHPLIPLHLFQNRWFTVDILTLFLAFMAIGTNNMILPFYLEDARAFSPGMAGVFMTVISAAMLVSSPVSGALSDRIGCERPSMIGLGIFCAGHVLLIFWGVETPIWFLAGNLFLVGAGNGMFQSPNNSLIMGSVEREDYGFAGSLSGLGRYMGMAVGITFSTSVLYGRMSAKAGEKVLGYVSGRPELFLSGMHLLYGCIVGILAVGLFLTIVRYRHGKKI